MHRLFVALRPPLAMRTYLLSRMGGVPGARWQDDAQLHLTLRFIGEVDRPQAEDIAAALGTITQPRPTITLRGSGAFDRKGKVHTLWAGVARDDGLSALYERINRALIRASVGPDERAFTPHITLARLNSAAGPVESFLARTTDLSSPPATLDAFLLYESTLGHGGPIYEAVARYPLT
ncbi:RNA 2',3'-cyclic phosphodiesterase [Sphingomonas sp. MMS24-J13]|uniref:RNA 2',3'-cyclic phosphodiesterase n=1 Tax=Sphingomonas sp. MMS24-J13 TaxID=3238686 RepID=UPI00384EB982